MSGATKPRPPDRLSKLDVIMNPETSVRSNPRPDGSRVW
jgi:hypothetical protein